MGEISEKVRKLRQDYQLGVLDETHVHADPVEQFRRWMDEALNAEIMEPNAMTLGTCGPGGMPSVRIVLLRGFDARGFVFFTNYESQKGRTLAQNPNAALNFYWPELERQVRIEGTVEKTSVEESDAYFLSRPRDNRLGAWASPQSSVIESREALEDSVKAQEGRFNGGDVHRPPNWGGFRLAPVSLEFWQGRASRLHDRIRYRRSGGVWVIERLAP